MIELIQNQENLMILAGNRFLTHLSQNLDQVSQGMKEKTEREVHLVISKVPCVTRQSALALSMP
jgi:hypothetical protein